MSTLVPGEQELLDDHAARVRHRLNRECGLPPSPWASAEAHAGYRAHVAHVEREERRRLARARTERRFVHAVEVFGRELPPLMGRFREWADGHRRRTLAKVAHDAELVRFLGEMSEAEWWMAHQTGPEAEAKNVLDANARGAGRPRRLL